MKHLLSVSLADSTCWVIPPCCNYGWAKVRISVCRNSLGLLKKRIKVQNKPCTFIFLGFFFGRYVIFQYIDVKKNSIGFLISYIQRGRTALMRSVSALAAVLKEWMMRNNFWNGQTKGVVPVTIFIILSSFLFSPVVLPCRPVWFHSVS